MRRKRTSQKRAIRPKRTRSHRIKRAPRRTARVSVLLGQRIVGELGLLRFALGRIAVALAARDEPATALRDLFAAHALTGVIAADQKGNPAAFAKECYELADALLRERGSR